MNESLASFRWRCGGLLAVALLALPPIAAAQAIGSGPLTSSLATAEPPTGLLRLGPAHIAPGVTVRGAGWDSNIFDEATDPKEDYVIAVVPDVAVFTRVPMVQVSAYGGVDISRYVEYESENSTGYAVRGRIDFLLSRLRPFVGSARIRTRERPNGEIDARANRLEQEWSGGVAYDLSDHSAFYVSAFQNTVRYDNAFEEGVNLSTSLDHDSNDYSVGVRTELTPLTTLTVSGSYQEDKFHNDMLRNGDNRLATGTVNIGADGIVSGVASVSYKDYRPVNPAVKPFRGVTALGALTYSFLEVGRLTFNGLRTTEYSFDTTEAYYLENTATLYYTQQLFGGVDAQVRGGRSLFDYAYSNTTPAHKDRLDTVGGSVGYNLSNRTRISANYEYTRRRSPVLPERNYDRRRAYLAWTYAAQ
jgi:hypothetical protein